MNQRLGSLLGAAAALAAVVGLLVPSAPPPDATTHPLSTDLGAHGFHALRAWLALGEVDVISLRERYDRLADFAPGQGHLLISVLPHKLPARATERALLADWVAAGNTALLLTAGAARPRWAAQLGRGDTAQVLQALGLDLAYSADADRTAPRFVKAPSDAILRPVGYHPLLDGVRNIAFDAPALGGEQISVTARNGSGVVLALLGDSGTKERDLWLARAGAGRVLVLGDASAFANGHLGAADNARLFDHLVARFLAPRGLVIFDDAHHGLTAFYDAQDFVRDPRLHVTLAFLLLLWLAWLLGHGNRFGPIVAAGGVESSAAYALALGGLFARQADPRDVAAQLIAHFERDCRRRLPQHFATPAIDQVLTSMPGVPAAALAGLRAARRVLAAGGCPDLIALANHLRQLRILL